MSPIIIESAITFVLAFKITTILHELAHALAGWMQGDRPVLYHTYVEHEPMSPLARMTTTAAGPVFSLFQGIILTAIYPLFSRFPILTQLFLLWLAIHGLVNFFGYLIATPFAPQADSGKIARYFNLSKVAQYSLCVVGIAANWLIGLAATRPFLQLVSAAGSDLATNSSAELVVAVAVIPWIIGSIVVILFRLPSPQPINLIYPILSGMFTLISWRTAESLPTPPRLPAQPEINLWPWLVILALVLFLFRFILARGIRLGRKAGPTDI